jgi:hypothetical protein
MMTIVIGLIQITTQGGWEVKKPYVGHGSIRILRTLGTHYEIYGTNCEAIDYVKK